MVKRIAVIVFAIVLAFLVIGCSKKPQKAELPATEKTMETASTTDAEAATETAATQSSPNHVPAALPAQTENESLGTPETISDTGSWDHPMKKVLEGFGFAIVKVELYKEKSYPVITVDSVEIGYNKDTHDQYIAFLNEAARANGYWDYAIFNRTMAQKFEVVCDRSGKSLKSITVNGKAVDVTQRKKSASKNTEVSEDQVTGYLMEQVPEIAQFNSQVEDYNKTNGSSGKPIMRIDSVPDSNGITPYERDFYAVYIGESMDSHTNRWATFLVRKDLKEILADDPATGQYITLQQWREQKNP